MKTKITSREFNDDIFFDNVNFESSASKRSQFPNDKLPEVAMVGRSNAGKSSVLNALFNRRKLAFTSKTPGKTQLLNFFTITNKKKVIGRVVDLPGYGYAKVERKIRENWAPTLNDYILSRKDLKGCFIVMDCRHPLSEFDQMMLDLLQKRNIKYHVLLNKTDKLNNAVKLKLKNVVTNKLKTYNTYYSMNGSISLISASKKIGLIEVREKLLNWIFTDTLKK